MTNLWKKAAVTASLTGMALVVPVLPQISPAAHAQVVTINGRYLNSGVQPISRNGRTLVAMRPIFEGLGANVSWDGANQRITAQTQNTEVVMQIGNTFAVVNGQPVKLDQAPMLYRGNTMVPLRFVSESLGANVNYNAAANSIGITTAGTTPQAPPQQVQTPTNNADAPNFQQGNGVSINLAKRIYAPTEPIELNFTAPAGLDYYTRADLIPADIQAGQPALDENLRLTYDNMRSKQRGTLNFKAPKEEGKYLFRVNAKNKQYTSIAFEVQAITPTVAPDFTMEKDVYVPGEPFKVNFKAPAFYSYYANISLVKSDVPLEDTVANRITRVNMQNKTQGELGFTAPKELGEYDLRFDDYYGHIIPAFSFTVEATSDSVQPTLAMSGSRFNKGDEIQVDFTAFPFYDYYARVVLIPAEFKNESLETIKPYVVTHQNLTKKTRGTLKFTAPKNDGVYTFILDDSHGNIIATTGNFAVGNASVADTRQTNTDQPADGNEQYADDNYQDGNANTENRGRAQDVVDDVADDAADAVGSGIKSKVRKGLGKIFK